ncbi:MAG: flavin-dependent oxidoreductase [Bacteroidota bacterium]|nr:flavin-dependent oxidoreductase [Bacteroidota bacterium]
MTGSKIMIAGAGIGGLTTALCLHARGIRCEVYEAAAAIKPLGVGINLLPHASRVLCELGLEKELSTMAVETSELIYYNRFGQKIWQEPRGKFAGYRWPQFSIHRGMFQMLLLKEVKRRLGEHCVHAGMRLESVSVRANAAAANFLYNDPAHGKASFEADALIAADGIHSAVRRQFYPEEGLPVFSGIILHRGTSIVPSFLTGSSMIMAGSVRQKFVAYPIGQAENGQQRINWVADLQVGKDGNIPPQDWNRKADKQQLLEAFANWTFSWMDVPGMIANADSIYEFPMSDRDPLPQWSFGPITLLGDAAHPMYPIGSNGASQAILDAECIAQCLAASPDVSNAFRQYESIRLPATSNIVLRNREMGPERVMQLAEERAPNGFQNIYDIIPKEELEAIAARYKQVAGFDMNSVNQKK